MKNQLRNDEMLKKSYKGFPLRMACLGWPPKGFYLFLDKKVAKNQGLELMSDKIVKA